MRIIMFPFIKVSGSNLSFWSSSLYIFLFMRHFFSSLLKLAFHPGHRYFLLLLHGLLSAQQAPALLLFQLLMSQHATHLQQVVPLMQELCGSIVLQSGVLQQGLDSLCLAISHVLHIGTHLRVLSLDGKALLLHLMLSTLLRGLNHRVLQLLLDQDTLDSVGFQHLCTLPLLLHDALLLMFFMGSLSCVCLALPLQLVETLLHSDVLQPRLLPHLLNRSLHSLLRRLQLPLLLLRPQLTLLQPLFLLPLEPLELLLQQLVRFLESADGLGQGCFFSRSHSSLSDHGLPPRFLTLLHLAHMELQDVFLPLLLFQVFFPLSRRRRLLHGCHSRFHFL
mmetsp:Transcript_23869/g.32819  ORF Transcript_23869/g.32819 Transcript_23869/m.32819 type:complete len:335 (+) Transcript_23869:285-1289(+)